MKLENTYVVILAGGIGSRFWPLSRENKPKQFLDILGTGKSLIQACYERYLKVVDPDHIYIIANGKYVPLIKEHLPEIKDEQILAEPFGKNTAPCVAYAAHKISDLNQDANMIVAPSDHLIINDENFFGQVKKAIDFCSDNDVLVTLGIKPHRPDTGYGYIQFIQEEVEEGINKVKTFTEKPPLEMAEKFLESGDFLWNSGMFIWSVNSVRKALEEHLTEMDLIFKEGNGAYNTSIESEHIEHIYSRIAGISIDNGLLEKADNVYVLPSDFGWSDLGTWRSVADNLESDDENKVIKAKVKSLNSSNNLVVSETEKLVVIKDVKDLYIIDTEDALLICPNDQEQEIKKIATSIKKEFNDKYS
ncbi:mannose-1-phosphate guanylyltransferase [bacterium]|nr:mannose-1-phosphate guanylyltransferase [bacterium]